MGVKISLSAVKTENQPVLLKYRPDGIFSIFYLNSSCGLNLGSKKKNSDFFYFAHLWSIFTKWRSQR